MIQWNSQYTWMTACVIKYLRHERYSFISTWMGSRELWNLIYFANTCMHKSWCVACIASVGFVRARGEISRIPTNVLGKYSLCVPLVCRGLSGIYLLGEKSRVAEGYELLRGVQGHAPPPQFFQMNMCCAILRNVTGCALTSSHLDDFSDSYLFSVMITIFFWGGGVELGIFFWGGGWKASTTQIP